MRLGTVTKQPNETESFTVSYIDALTAGDIVIAATATVAVYGAVPPGVVPALITLTPMVIANPRVRMFASGGTDGVTYKIELLTVTNDGRVLNDEFFIKVKDV